MKALVMKMIKAFRENVWLTVVGVIVLVVFGVIVWNWSLNMTRKLISNDSIVVLYEAETKSGMLVVDSDSTNNDEVMNLIIEDGEAYIRTNSGETVFGPCRYIFNDISSYNNVFRFVAQNGLIGYAKLENMTVSVLHEGKFTEASEMADGSACVKEGEYYYFIDKDGNRFTQGKYIEAYPFAESQGCFARVKDQDGNWSIIDKKENAVLDGFSRINELPCVTTSGAGVKDGKAVLFSLEYCEDMQPRITCVLDEYVDVNMDYGDSDYAVVTDKQGNKGVVSKWNGEVLVPSEYADIQYGYVEYGKGENLKQRWFCCQKKDGSFDYIYNNEGEW